MSPHRVSRHGYWSTAETRMSDDGHYMTSMPARRFVPLSR